MAAKARTRLPLAMLAALALATAACGSTVSDAERAAASAGGAGLEEGLGVQPTGGESAAGPDTTAGGSGSGEAAPGGGGTGGGTGGGSGGSSGGTGGGGTGGGGTGGGGGGGSGGATGPIKIGLGYDRNAGALNTAFGFAGVGQIDQKRSLDAVVSYINKNGGVGGRPLEIVYYVADSTSGKSAETVAQEVCATFTQDNRVDAVMFSGIDTIRECLNQAGVIQVGQGIGFSDSKTFAQYPYLVETDAPAMDRLARFYVKSMVDQGYYTRGRVAPGAKVGIVAYDEPVFDRALDVMRSELRAAGVATPRVVQIRRAQSADAQADEVRQIQSAVLSFNTAGVTHVQFMSTANAFMQFIFWQQADIQRYYPRYGLSSQDAAQALIPTLEAANGNGAAARTFESALAVGWSPLRDIPLADYSGSAESPALRLCKKILSDAGETFGGSDTARNKEQVSAGVCDPLFYFKAAVEAGGSFSLPNFLRGVASVGTVPSVYTFDMGTTATRHDAMGAVRNLKYVNDCNCWRYTSGLIGV